MLRAGAQDRQRMQIEPLVKDRLEILHGEDVVRRLQQLCQRAHAPRDRLLPRRRKRDAGLQLGAQVFAQQRIEQRLGHPLQRLQLAALAAEAQMRHHAETAQQPHGAAGKALRRRQRPRQRQLQHQIRPAAGSGLRARKLRIHRRAAALRKVARHDAHDRAVRAQTRARLLDEPCMAVVKRVILRNDADDISHFCTFFRKILAFSTEMITIRVLWHHNTVVLRKLQYFI